MKVWIMDTVGLERYEHEVPDVLATIENRKVRLAAAAAIVATDIDAEIGTIKEFADPVLVFTWGRNQTYAITDAPDADPGLALRKDED